MMNLNLNFLPDKNRKDITVYSYLGWALNLLRASIVALVFFDAFLILIWQAADEQAAVLAKQSGDSADNSAFYGNQIIEINDKITAVSRAGENFGALTPRFQEIMSTLPANIKLKNLDVGTDTPGSLTLAGMAKTRDALIAYSEQLGRVSWVEKVNMPKSLLLQKENIEFTLELAVKPFAIK